jgi:hypothetical protein
MDTTRNILGEEKFSQLYLKGKKTMEQIKIIFYSYKNKQVKKNIQNIKESSSVPIDIFLIDQDSIDKHLEFSDLVYSHVFWDSLESPVKLKYKEILETEQSHILIISDDVTLSPGWDKALLDFVKNKKVIVSGYGELKLTNKDSFMLNHERSQSNDFILTNMVDKNFIFADSKILKNISFPTFLKYYGEDEMLSLMLFTNGIDVYSCPENIYKDSNDRPLENRYTTMSLEHNYNDFISLIKDKKEIAGFSLGPARSISDFIQFHKIDTDSLYKLPFQNNDVEYNYHNLEIQHLDSRRFLSNVKAIY